MVIHKKVKLEFINFRYTIGGNMRQSRSKKHKWLCLLCILAMLSGLLQQNGLWNPALEALASEQDPVISIQTPQELQKIGSSPDYPMDGDYILTSDLDMSGISFIPIGGTKGEKGAVSGKNVFSGTFDGQGHLISNLNIRVTESLSSTEYAQIGLFSILASADASDYAQVKNLVFADVSINADITGGFTAAGTLAGEVNGYASVDNICVLTGNVTVNGSNQSDTVGAAGLIGECRTNAPMGNAFISITNVFNGAEILAGSSSTLNYAGGIIGRVSGTCKKISGCVNIGRTSFKGDLGLGIASFHNAESSCLDSAYFLFDTGRAANSTELTEEDLKSGKLPHGLDPDAWYTSEGAYPLPSICQNSSAADYIVLASLTPILAEGDMLSSVTKDFILPERIGEITLSWESSDAAVIAIDGTAAKVSGVLSDTKVTLKATTDTGLTKSFSITVVSNIKAVFEENYAKPGTPLTVTIENAPADLSCSYTWSVDGRTLTGVTGNSYIPEESDVEKFIKVVVYSPAYQVNWEASIYCSELPVVYIDTEDGRDVTDKGTYKAAHMRLQGNDKFTKSSALYDGAAEIKGRGNSTWDFAAANGLKKPYKLKLDSKSNILDMGKNKHWVLLANVIDHTNMRNQLMTEFSRDIGMECYLDAEPVVLILNGSYIGLYQLYEHKRVGETRINVYDWEGLGEDIAGAIAKKEGISGSQKKALEDHMTTDFSWYDNGSVSWNGKSYTVTDYYKDEIPAFTGGFVYDMDFRLNDSKYVSKFWTTFGYPIFFEAPEFAKTSQTMMNYGKTYLQAFEDALHAEDFYAPFQNQDLHYSQLYDIDSLVQNWFVVEYSMNWDGMKNSTLMYKDLDDLLKMGPAWDFDWCWGNINMYSMTSPYVITGWHTTTDSFCEQGYQRENWNRYLVSDPYFATLVFEKWQEIRDTVIEDMIKDGGKIDTLQETYRKSSEANDRKWDYSYNRYSGMGITNGQEVLKQSELYDDAVASMKYFIKKRVAWFDTQFTSVDHLLSSWGRYRGSGELQVSDIQTDDHQPSQITATVTNASAKKIAFYVNGIYAGASDVIQNKAIIALDDQYLREGQNVSNTVQIRALDASGNWVSSGGKPLTNYRNFKKEIVSKLTGTVTIQGDALCGSTLKAVLKDTNNTGTLSYQWLADDAAIPGATSDSYVLTESEIGKKMRVRITSSQEVGELLSEATEKVEEQTIDIQTEHLIIHQVYGTGAKGDTPLSHSFIELYNPTDAPVDLNGYRIGYLSNSENAASTTDGAYTVKDLGGVLPSHCSYLIRCASDYMTAQDPHHEIQAGDLEWPERVIDNKQFQVVLTKESQQIDALSVEEDALEGTPFTGLSKQKSARRSGFVDTDNNSRDFVIAAYNSKDTDFEAVRPRSLSDGVWGMSEPDPKPDVTLKGQVLIRGTAKSGETLTAELSGCNASPASLTYTWTADGTVIQKTGENTVVLTDEQVGKMITVIISSSEKTGTLESTPTVPVEKSGEGSPDNPDNPDHPDTPGGEEIPDPPAPVMAVSVTMNQTSVTLPKKGKLQLRAVILPANTENQSLIWSSSNNTVATVDSSGFVTAHKKGTSEISATTVNGKTAKAVVTVSEVTLQASSAKMQKGTSTAVLGIRQHYPASDKVSAWTSSKKKVAVVSSTGKIKALSPGTTTITVTMKSGAAASCRLTVTKNVIKTKKLSLSKKKITLRKGKTYRIKVSRKPLTANDPLTYTTSKKQVAFVSGKGIIKAKQKGTAKIKIRSKSGKSVTMIVKVRK